MNKISYGLRLAILAATFVFIAIAPRSGHAASTAVVYKCEVNGKVVYTDDPCLGAQRLDVQPTRGMNKSTGKELIGADVARERRQEMWADGLKPLTGMNRQQYEVFSHRVNLSAGAKVACTKFDAAIPELEKRERTGDAKSKLAAQTELLAVRKQFRDLRC